MNRLLLDLLICPSCLPEEFPLSAHIRQIRQGDVFSALLTCPGCSQEYPVENGIARLLPRSSATSVNRYEQPQVVSAYLWSHYADLFEDPDAHDAYHNWAGLLAGQGGLAIDIGCAVGRLTFELCRTAELAIGIDRSLAFIETSRQLLQDRQLNFGLTVEGQLSDYRQIKLPAGWPLQRAEFIQADALALPFPAKAFSRGSSLNLLDKLSSPLHHLHELNRVSGHRGAALLVSDPWSWSTEFAPETAWLGGVADGPYAGHGHVNVSRILEHDLRPCWKIYKEGAVRWTIRNHRNHFEHIHSDYLLAKR